MPMPVLAEKLFVRSTQIGIQTHAHACAVREINCALDVQNPCPCLCCMELILRSIKKQSLSTQLEHHGRRGAGIIGYHFDASNAHW